MDNRGKTCFCDGVSFWRFMCLFTTGVFMVKNEFFTQKNRIFNKKFNIGIL